MATNTSHLGLVKPAYTDAADVAVINNNMDTIDTAISHILPVITGSTNNSGYTIATGHYFEANGSVYKATASIGTGSSWSGNASAVSGTALNAAFDSLSSKIAHVEISNQYSTVLAAINAYRNQKSMPFTIRKTANSATTDLPSGVSDTCEWTVICYGSSERLTAQLTVFTGGSSNNGSTYTANIFNGEYIFTWDKLALKSDLNANTNTKISYNTAFDITIPSSAASSHYYCDRVGRTVFIDVVFLSSSAINANTQITHVDGLTGLMESHVSSIGSNGSGGRFLVGSYGAIKTERAIPANEWFSFTVVCQYNNSI